ncbi:phosphopantetheine-binding protein [Streptomyces sp. NPDC048566]|uniref:phosphopantetheine-binding protein n=1 Tax=Streptomyces sp. NPDC048566 TaxID=3365569 RepID=UPI0037136BFE
MHDEDQFSRPTAFGASHESLLSGLVTVLADVLRITPERIDTEETFRLLGLGSLLSVQFVAALNGHYGTDLRVDVLLDHPTPAALARHLTHAVLSSTGPTDAQPTPAHAEPLPGAEAHDDAVGQVLETLREELARILCCDPWDLHTDSPFVVLGVDSVIAAEFVAAVNRIYGLQEPAGTLYDHPDLVSLAVHIVAAAPPHQVPEILPAVMGVRVPGAAPLGVGALLDAVRAGWMSVDDALGHLARRA